MESSDNVCLVCHEHIEFFAIGRCDHPICYKCSTRMRALCEQFYCPICRTDLPEVFFLKTMEKFGEMPMRKFIMNRKLKIQFEDESVRERFEKLLEHRCTKCPDRYPERNFKALRDHMRRVHTLFYCDLCLELKIFSRERKAYNRHDLAIHRRVGDKDDKSYKGHPLCQFCEERYLDKDELYKHLRKDHFFCHFCESLGSQEFYDDYPTLREHFYTEHYLCEEGDCANAQFTNAFRSDIDLKSHQAHDHSKAQTKLQSRQERTINIDINLVPRPNSRPQRGREQRREENEDVRRGGPRNQGNRGARSNRYNNTSYREKQDVDRAIQASLSTMNDEDMKKSKSKPKVESSSSSEDEFAQTEANFPALGAQPQEISQPVVPKSQAPVSTATSTAVSSTTTESTGKRSLADRFAMSNSMSVQHGILNDFPSLSPRSDSPKTVLPPKGRGSKFSSTYSAKKTEEDFPDLPSSNKSTKTAHGSWLQPEKKVNVIDKPASKRPNNRRKAPTSYDVNDFPTLGAPSNKSNNDKWFNTTSAAPAKMTKETNSNNNNKEMTTKEVLERFSPVNVPDSPKTERSKNKKKKKKEKVTEIKNEETGNSGTLKGNSSLDDIASLLMNSNKREEKIFPKEELVGKPNEISNKVEPKPEKSKGKKKIDKIEKKMETEKEELNIAELKISEPDTRTAVQPQRVKFANADEEFPSLGSKSPPKKPPPGFKQEQEPVKSSAPPGFGKPMSANNKVPPGFGSKNTLGNFQNGVMGENVLQMSADNGNFQYSQPDDFQERNQMLIGTVRSFCAADSAQFADFKTISGEFRRSDITSLQYYNRCGDILGKDNFLEVFPELLALLPDIDKQQELLAVYMQSECMKKDDKVLKISGKSKNAKGAWTKTQSGFLTCQTCRQVLVRKDYNSHLLLHNLNTDFPSLGSGSGSSQKVGMGGGWVKAK